jgi:hypothetical protein
MSAGGREAVTLACRIAEPVDEIVVGTGQLVAEQNQLTKRYAALAGRTHSVDRGKNQIRGTSTIRLPCERVSWRIGSPGWVTGSVS